MEVYYSRSNTNLNKPIRIILASCSKLFLEGVHKILENDSDIKIVDKVSSYKELKACLGQIKPEFLFFDNRTLEVSIHELCKLIGKKSANTKVVLFRNQVENEIKFSNVQFVTEKTTSFDLMRFIKGGIPNNNGQIQEFGDINNNELTITEVKVLGLVGAGYSNKEIAKSLLITERTAKCHLNNLFKKLGLHNRYQLIVYVRRRRLQRRQK
ncbi:MAG TPA: response regulator transcription factor [Thermodesulfobacteriota bacterium]|nr:response regulator transcription factor [Thermodesulfobacteriota bacterium]